MSEPVPPPGNPPSTGASTPGNASISSPATGAAAATAAKTAAKQNPAFQAMGLPNLRAKLPSRNWTIFFSIVGVWTGLVVYDRRQKSLSKQHWIKVVSPLAEEPIAPLALPRKITVYLSAPPGDNLLPAREVFSEYVKPILVAAAVDYEVVESRREGGIWREVRDGIFRIRRGLEQLPTEGEEDAVEELRKRAGVQRTETIGGELVLGRHTWKEWMRGVEEGWLSDSETLKLSKDERAELKLIPREELSTRELAGRRTEYLAPPVTAVHSPNLLGFLNFPWRIGRFLTQRKLADEVGREVAALCLAVVKDGVENAEEVLKKEEADWPKSVWKVEEVEEEVKEEVEKEEEPPKPVDEKEVIDAAVAVIEGESAKKEEEKKEDKKKEEKKFISPGIWREEMKVNSRMLEGLRSFQLPAEAERKPEDFRWW